MTDIKVIPQFHCLNKSSHGSFADTAVTSSSPPPHWYHYLFHSRGLILRISPILYFKCSIFRTLDQSHVHILKLQKGVEKKDLLTSTCSVGGRALNALGTVY